MAEKDRNDPLSDFRRRTPDDEWIGSTHAAPPRAEVIEVDVAEIGYGSPVAADHPSGAPMSAYPYATPSRAPFRLWLGDQEAVPMTIINNDDRKQYDDWRYPWGLVCRVSSFNGGVGSGVLVGPRHVLTASHCVDWDDLRMSVDVHVHGTVVRATAVVEKAGCFTKVASGHGFDQVDEDYAVLIIDQRLGDRFGWMGVRTYESRWDETELWETIGYSTDQIGGSGTVPTWQPSFYLDEDAADFGWGRAMSTNADVFRGQSGSPVFAFWSDGPYAVAVIVAEVGEENYCAGGVGLTRLVGRIRELEP